MSTASDPLGRPARPYTGFRRVLCAVNGTRAAEAAARQALLLAGSDGAVAFLAVSDARGTGPMAQASLSEAHAERLVEAARVAAVQAGVPATAFATRSDDPCGTILDMAREFDLLAIGAHGHSRVAAALVGSVAANALHSAPGPVLVARGSDDTPFPGLILVGSRGLQDHAVARAAAEIAAAHGSPVVLAHAESPDAGTRRGLAVQAAMLLEITGTDPVVHTLDGPAAESLPALAGSLEAGLLVLGSRHRTGVRAITSVSERAAHAAPCSVLVLR